MLGAGAANTTIARLMIADGANPKNFTIFDSRGSLNVDRKDLEENKKFYRKWELCKSTNPDKINDFEQAMTGADVLIALSTPGPDTVKPEWIKVMADKSIVLHVQIRYPKFILMLQKKQVLIFVQQEEAISLIR